MFIKILLTIIFSLSEALVCSSIMFVFIRYPDEPMCTVIFLYGCFLLYVVLPTNVMMKIINKRSKAKIKMLEDELNKTTRETDNNHCK